MLPDAVKDAFIAALKMTREIRLQKAPPKSASAEIMILSAATLAEELARKPVAASEERGLRSLLISLAAQLAALYRINYPEFRKDAGQFTDSVIAELTSLFTPPELEAGGLIGSEAAGFLTETLGEYLQSSFEAAVIAKIREEPVSRLRLRPGTFQAIF